MGSKLAPPSRHCSPDPRRSPADLGDWVSATGGTAPLTNGPAAAAIIDPPRVCPGMSRRVQSSDNRSAADGVSQVICSDLRVGLSPVAPQATATEASEVSPPSPTARTSALAATAEHRFGADWMRRSTTNRVTGQTVREAASSGYLNASAPPWSRCPPRITCIETGQPYCPVATKAASVRLRLRVIFRGSELPCESLPGCGRSQDRAAESRRHPRVLRGRPSSAMSVPDAGPVLADCWVSSR